MDLPGHLVGGRDGQRCYSRLLHFAGTVLRVPGLPGFTSFVAFSALGR